MPALTNKEIWLRIIESEKVIDDRFFDIKRIDPNGGSGQFSLVFLAKDKMSKRNKEVVLKFYNPNRMSAEDKYFYDAFFREGEILNSLRGKRNILPFIKGIETINISVPISPTPFVLPFNYYVVHKAKCSVADYIYGNSTTLIKNIRYFREMCKGIQRIHAQKIAHRDIKPHNFLVFDYGYICVSDFGSARDYRMATHLISDYDNSVFADPTYLAPEHCAFLCYSDEFNFFADFFSLGCVLFELFTQSQLKNFIPFDSECNSLVSIDKKHRKNTFTDALINLTNKYLLPDIQKINPGIPKYLHQELNKLYKSLAELDYRKRERNFENIFRRINICEKLILIYSKKKY